MDDYEEELDRWIHRAQARLRGLPAGSQQERQLAAAIRGMEHEQLRCRINRAHSDLDRLLAGSEERHKLAQALDRMEEEYSSTQREIPNRMQESSGGGRPIQIVAEAREALQRASVGLAHTAADARVGEAIAEIERALARLKEYERRTRKS